MKLRGEMFMDKMKDSGIKWIGTIPEHWEVEEISKLFTQRNTKVSDFDFPPLSVTKKGIVPQLESAAKSDDHTNRKLVKKDDFVINSRSDRKMSSGVSEFDGSVSLINLVMIPKQEKLSVPFVKYLLKNYGFAEEFYRWGTGIVDDLWSTNWERGKKIQLPIPPISEQQRIAKFLDEKTALIDEIISDSKKSIEELKAYKQSLITEIVTKGLDPNVTLVPSGIDWIGDIPEGWEVVRSKNILSYSKGLSITKENLTETGIPVINYGQIHSKYPVYFNPRINQLPFVSNVYLESKKNALLNQGDFVFADTSEDISGSGNFSSLTSDGIVFAGYHTIIARIIDKTRINFRYLAYYFSSELHRKQVGSRVSGVKVFSISQKILKSMLILLPNRDEQDSIANYLDQKIAQIDAIIAEKENLISEYESYKKSIIYEYVTGKKQVEGYES
mgnify:CR=1 FL=1